MVIMPRANVGQKLTKRVIDQVDLSQGRQTLWDCELRGFGVQIEPTGTKTYFVRYRPKGLGRDGARRFFKIGRHGDLTPDSARELAKAVLGKVAAGGDPAAEKAAERRDYVERRNALTVSTLGEAFVKEHASRLRRTKTAVNYEILFRRHINPFLGSRGAIQITRVDLADLHGTMRDTPANANRVLATLSSMYVFAAKRGLLPDGFNPTVGLDRYREEGRERYLTSDELRRLGNALIDAETVGIPWLIDLANPKSKHTPKAWKGQRELLDPNAVAAIRLLLFTGARLREILHLKWTYVDLERGLLFLPESKTGKKTIILNDAALAVLRQLRSARDLAVPADVYVILGGTDARPRSDLKRPWAAISRHAQLQNVRLHDLRHTFASIGAGASLGLPIVGALLGHSQPQTTARYAHLDSSPLRRAANVIGDELAAALNPKEK